MVRVVAGLLFLGLIFGLVRADDKNKSSYELSKEEKTLLTLTNDERTKEELRPLEPHPLLMQIAREHSANMARQGKMTHKLDGKGPAERAKGAGYRYARIGENVAWSQGGTLKEILKGWMNSPAHRANIMNKDYREIGLGVAENDKGEKYYTQVFGRRLQVK